MRIELREFRLIISAILLVAGVSIACWAFASHYEIKMKMAGSQQEAINDIFTTRVMSSALDHSKISLLLVCIGLVGFFGVRRQSSTPKIFVTENRSKIKLRINLLTKNDLDGQTCRRGVPGCVAS